MSHEPKCLRAMNESPMAFETVSQSCSSLSPLGKAAQFYIDNRENISVAFAADRFGVNPKTLESSVSTLDRHSSLDYTEVSRNGRPSTVTPAILRQLSSFLHDRHVDGHDTAFTEFFIHADELARVHSSADGITRRTLKRLIERHPAELSLRKPHRLEAAHKIAVYLALEP